MSQKKNEMVQRLALWRHTKFDWLTVFERYSDDIEPRHDDYVRVTEWMDVEFKPLSSSDVAAAQMVALSTLREHTVNEFKEKLGYIDGKIANLRALTGPEDDAALQRPQRGEGE